MSFDPEGGRIVTGSRDGTARIWNARSGKILTTLRGHGGGVSSAAFSGDGLTIATAAQDRTVRIWDAATGAELACLRGHTEAAQCAFSADFDRLLSVSHDGTACIWDLTRTRAVAGDIALSLTAALARGVGRRTDVEFAGPPHAGSAGRSVRRSKTAAPRFHHSRFDRDRSERQAAGGQDICPCNRAAGPLLPEPVRIREPFMSISGGLHGHSQHVVAHGAAGRGADQVSIRQLGPASCVFSSLMLAATVSNSRIGWSDHCRIAASTPTSIARTSRRANLGSDACRILSARPTR